MADPRTLLAEVAREKSDYRMTAQIVDALGAGIPAASLATLTLTLYVQDASLTILNSVSGTNILNTGRGTVDSSGNLVISLLPADSPISDTTLAEELHVALVQWTYNGGASAGKHELAFRVRNLGLVS